MKLVLNIYNRGKIEKSYTANEFDIELGTLEDLINLVDSKVIFNDNKKDKEWFADVLTMLSKAGDTLKELLKQVFVDVTDEELRHIRIKQVVKKVILPMLSLSDFGLETTSKN